MQVNLPLLTILLSGASYSSAIFVYTLSGPVLGSEVFHAGKPIRRFLGIPYAEPPVGDLRFKKTVPVQPWLVPYPAQIHRPCCVQDYPYSHPWTDEMPPQRENCLHLNIWVPDKASRHTPKSVMFWIHGGGLATGSNRIPDYDGQVLAAEYDVIVVSVNYRLGILGFLATESEEAPGNMGLYDILEGLKWINNNIEAFGGNSKSITLFGNNVGATISGLFIVSPLTRGLFQRAIQESEGPSPEHTDTYRANLQLGQKVAVAVRCASESVTLQRNPEEVVRCLRRKNSEDLTKAVTSFTNGTFSGFLPVYGSQILPMHPYDALEQNSYQPVDLMFGNSRDEGSFLVAVYYPKIFGPYGEKNPRINKTLGREIINGLLGDINIGDEIADYYLDNLREDDYDGIRSQTYHAAGDYMVFCRNTYFSQLFSSKGNNVYSYFFNHQSANSVFEQWMGGVHFTEIPFVFGRPFDTYGYSQDERILSKRIMEMWTNFAKNGFPSSTWKKFSYPEFYTEQIQTDDSYDNHFLNHWKNCEFLRNYMLY